MRSFKEIYEASEYKIYMIDNTLWVAYGDGSGTTTQVNNLNTFFTDKDRDSHYDTIVHNLMKFAKSTKPIETKKSKSQLAYPSTFLLYELPVYLMQDIKSNPSHKISAWGGDIKPNKTYYLMITEQKEYNIVHIFTKKGEAKAWMNSIS